MAKEVETIDGDLIAAELTQRHQRYLAAYSKGLANACMALHKIRTEETYTADGYEDFTTFLVDWGIGRSQGYALAAAGPVFRLLEAAGDAGLVTSIEQLRPISKMNPENQARCVQLAGSKAAEKRADGQPKINKNLVAEVGAAHFNWFQKAKKPADTNAKPPLLVDVEKACYTLAFMPLTPEEAVEEFGDPRHWVDFPQALEKMEALWSVGQGREPGEDG